MTININGFQELEMDFSLQYMHKWQYNQFKYIPIFQHGPDSLIAPKKIAKLSLLIEAVSKIKLTWRLCQKWKKLKLLMLMSNGMMSWNIR